MADRPAYLPFPDPRPGAAPPADPASGLLSALMHDLRNVLSAIQVLSQLGARRSGAESQEYFRQIDEQVRLLFELLKVLREAMAPEAFVSVSPAEALRAAAEEAAQAGRAAGVRLEWRQEGDCRLSLRPALFQRAALALLRFAVQGMPGGGRLSAAATCGAAVAELTISGEGAPPAEEERDELFRPFSRGPAGEGGLELYLAGLVFTRLLRGELRLEAGEGGGTLFRLRLPLS